ncbi:hypothetical protein [Ancylobacter sp. TS-1]|uniref:hypothetical protein n=1 Tax=Ancylobacter sp. TS-1 TaxID=1850374 RepID=UPI001265CA09|nr:hypothetical protein [Ancylobacter sp. TS-1]QFR34699.1 hypothetical protein GBB76_17205 [Ancylobacter sp. TS-1]
MVTIAELTTRRPNIPASGGGFLSGFANGASEYLDQRQQADAFRPYLDSIYGEAPRQPSFVERLLGTGASQQPTPGGSMALQPPVGPSPEAEAGRRSLAALNEASPPASAGAIPARTIGNLGAPPQPPRIPREAMERLLMTPEGRRFAQMIMPGGEMDYRRQQDQSDRDFQERKFAADQEERRLAREADASYRGRSLSLQERAFREGRIPAGYRATADGGMEPIPGAPSDPAAALKARRSAAEAAGFTPDAPGYNRYLLTGEIPAGRALPQNTVNTLGEAGSAYADLNRISGGFQDSYGGQPWLGDANNWWGRTFSDAGSDTGKQAQWWQDYQGQKNLVRNRLFGSALTATEKGEFEKADINPGMSPTSITANLTRQKAVAERAARKLADYYTKAGYAPDQIEAAIGVPLAELGISPGRGGAGRGQTGGGGGGGVTEGATATNPQTGERMIFRGGAWSPM